jgi:hypothetical protein
MFPGMGLVGLPPMGLQKLFWDFAGGDGGGGTGRAKAREQANIANRASTNFVCRGFMAVTVRGKGRLYWGAILGTPPWHNRESAHRSANARQRPIAE